MNFYQTLVGLAAITAVVVFVVLGDASVRTKLRVVAVLVMALLLPRYLPQGEIAKLIIQALLAIGIALYFKVVGALG